MHPGTGSFSNCAIRLTWGVINNSITWDDHQGNHNKRPLSPHGHVTHGHFGALNRGILINPHFCRALIVPSYSPSRWQTPPGLQPTVMTVGYNPGGYPLTILANRTPNQTLAQCPCLTPERHAGGRRTGWSGRVHPATRRFF